MKPTMSQVLHTSLLELHGEALNELDNIKHDYAIVSAERNRLRAHADALAAALRDAKRFITTIEKSGVFEVTSNDLDGKLDWDVRFIIQDALAAYEGSKHGD